MKLNPYASFNGNCEEAFKLYERVLGGKIDNLIRYEGSPMAKHAPGDYGSKIMHARIDIGGVMLMGSDRVPGDYNPPAGIQLSLDIAGVEEAERIFTGLSEGGIVQMPLQQTFWAARFGMFTDRFGVPWMVNCEAT